MTYSVSLRINLQVTGSNINIWGDIANAQVFTPIETAIAGWLTKALSGNYTLTTANGVSDEARTAMIKFTGAGPFTVTIPSVSKAYDFWNACSGAVTITTGAGDAVTLLPGEIVRTICDGSNVERSQGTYFQSQRLQAVADPISDQDAATKKYVDNTAWTYNAGNLPGQSPPVNGFALVTNGTVASWKQLTSADLSDTPARDAAALGRAVAMAFALY